MFSLHHRSRRPSAIAHALGVACVAAAALFIGTAAHAEDYAIVCGVNQYPALRPGSNLNGCVNDAKLFAAKLKNYGFKDANIISLYDGAATHDGILTAIKNAKVTNRDRVVFYFAGHGTVGSSGDSVILPNDASDTSEEKDVQTSELFDAVKGLPARNKTIVLDSCHSGGMVRGKKGLTGLNGSKPRFYVRTAKLSRGTKEWITVKTNKADVLEDQTGDADGKICYFTAALKSQTAAETTCGGEQHGVFTYSLAKYMTGNKSLWQELSASVSADVSQMTDGEQKPVLFPTDFLQKIAFGAIGGAPTPAPEPLSLEKLFALSSPDPSKISLIFTPSTSPVVKMKDEVQFNVSVGATGYLVVIGRDPAGKLTLYFPAQGQSPAVQSGSKLTIPDSPVVADTAGTDSVKALLFTSEEAARSFTRSFARGSIKLDGVGKREWIKKVAPGPGYYTSEVITQVVEQGTLTDVAGMAAP